MSEFTACKESVNNGFTMTFPNGYTVSVRWGWGNYCDNRSWNVDYYNNPPDCSTSSNAEVAVWGSNGDFVQAPGVRGDVWTCQTTQEVALLVFQVANWSKEPNGNERS